MKNVDFFAVLIITLALLAFSKVSSLRAPEAFDSIRFADAIRVEPSPLPAKILSRLADILP